MEALNFAENWWLSGFVYFLAVVALFVFLKYRQKIMEFIGQVRTELGKCTWPWNPEQTGLRKYKVLIDSTVVVSVSTLLLAGYITGFDFLINQLVSWLVGF